MFLPRRLNISNILLLVRARKRVEWCWCGSCGHSFCPVFNKRKELPLDLRVVEWKRDVMAHAQKPDLVFQRNGRVHLYRRGCQFSKLLAAEVCASTHTWESHGRLDAEGAERLQNSFCAIRRPNIGCDTQDGYSYSHCRNTNMPEAVTHRQRLSISYAIFPLEINLKTWNSKGLCLIQLELLCRTRAYCSADRW